jgi:nitrous oxidase accessory protein NosD
VKDVAGNRLPRDESWTFNIAAGALTPQPPLVLEQKRNVSLSGIHIRNLDGPCVIIRGSQNVILENSELGPCKGGVIIENSSRVTVRNTFIHDSGRDGNGAEVLFSRDVDIRGNHIERVRAGVYALQSASVRVTGNHMKNIQGPPPRGQFVQFDKTSGPAQRITCNTLENIQGESRAEDAISVYASSGEPSDPILIAGNVIRGGGPSPSGGGILLGDAGGAFQTARGNVLVDPGQYGIGVAGGSGIAVTANSVFARRQPFTNVGIYVWNQGQSPCRGITVEDNSVNWTKSDQSPNPAWNAGNCGDVAGWSTNHWSAALKPDLATRRPPSCHE